MHGDYIKNLYNDRIERYADISKSKKLNDSTWRKSNRYIKIAGIQSRYYKTSETFRDMCFENKGISVVINTLSVDECMVTMFDTDMRIVMRFKQNKRDINDEIINL